MNEPQSITPDPACNCSGASRPLLRAAAGVDGDLKQVRTRPEYARFVVAELTRGGMSKHGRFPDETWHR